MKKVYGVTEFAEMRGMRPQRLRKLLRQERVFPYQRLDNGRYLLFCNTVVVPPYERPNRKLRLQRVKED